MKNPSLGAAVVMAVAGGILMNLAFPPLNLWWAAFPALALLLWALEAARVWRSLLVGLLWGLAFFGPFLFWAYYAVDQAVPWLGLTALQAGYVALFAFLFAYVRRRRVAQGKGALVAALLWVAVEQMRMLWPFGGFPWGAVAFAQVDGPLLALASWGGTVLVSLVVMLVAYGLHTLVTGWRRPVAALAAGLAAAAAVGATTLVPLPTDGQTGELRVAVVQGSVPAQGEEALGQAAEITANYRALAVGMAGTPMDLMVWPESAADLDPRTHDDVGEDVRAAAAAVGVPLLLGTQRYVDDVRYNEYLLWLAEGPTAVYTKQHPVPFGEYIPYREFFRKLSSAVDLVSTDMAAGTEPGLLSVPVARLGRDVPLGVGICFEVGYDDLIRQNVELGAEMLVIPTNNASFGYSQEGAQQLGISRFRAVEHGRSTIQVATTGVSGVFLPDGSVLARSGELYTEWTTVANLPLRTYLTPATRAGTWPRLAVWALAGVWLAAAFVSVSLEARTGRRRVAEPERSGVL